MATNPVKKPYIIHLVEDKDGPALCGDTTPRDSSKGEYFDYPEFWAYGDSKDYEWDEDAYKRKERPFVCSLCWELLPIWMISH